MNSPKNCVRSVHRRLSRAALNSMIAVHAFRTGHEQFTVTYEFQGYPAYAYNCVENESQAGDEPAFLFCNALFLKPETESGEPKTVS